uniref:G-protein coupled receptors family 1 profile domain-containing protein n=2 Tax=Anopheles melas TaxID=34690 RepID=A0A182UHR5_9DIPT
MSPPDDSTETEPPSAMSTAVVTVATLLAERCLGCAINYTGAAAAANPPGERLQSDFGRPTTPAPRHNWTWSYLNLSAPQQYDTFDGEYEIDPAYQLRYSVLGTVLLTVAYALVFILGLLGNISVVIVVKKSTMMRSPTNRFIVNLAYADLLVNFLCLPFTLIGNLYPGKMSTRSCSPEYYTHRGTYIVTQESRRQGASGSNLWFFSRQSIRANAGGNGDFCRCCCHP